MAQRNILLPGNLVRDTVIIVDHEDRYRLYRPGISIDEVIACAARSSILQGNNITDAVHHDYGGTALTWTQYLRPVHAVTVASVYGTDRESRDVKAILRDKLGVNMMALKGYAGSLPRCAVVDFPGQKPRYRMRGSRRRKRRRLQPIVYWEPNIADRFDTLEISDDILALHDVLALPITFPDLGLDIARRFIDRRPEGVVLYNPGRYLCRKDYTFDQTRFEEMLPLTRALVLNRQEAETVRGGMGTRNLEDLFEESDRLEIIAETRDKDGSIVHHKVSGNGCRKHTYKPGRRKRAKPMGLGAGDAWAATFFSQWLRGYDVETAQNSASQAAEEILGVPCALNHRRVYKGQTTISPRASVEDTELKNGSAAK